MTYMDEEGQNECYKCEHRHCEELFTLSVTNE